MSIIASFARDQHFAEVLSGLQTNAGWLTPAQRQAICRANLGVPSAASLGSMAFQNANAVSITGGTVSNIVLSNSNLSNTAISGSSFTGGTISGLTAPLPVASGGTGVATSTGSGSVVLSNSPALVTPNLGTPSAINLANATNLPVGGISGLATGIATWLATPSSANLRAAMTDESGTGALLFQSGALGTPASGVATNLTGLPLTTGVTGILPQANGGTGLTSLGTAISANTGTSGHALGFLDGANTWSALQTMSSGLTINGGTFTLSSIAQNITGASGTNRTIAFQTAGTIRFGVDISSTAESGGNVGSDWRVNRYDDTGTYINTPIMVTRSTGVTNITNLTLGTALPVSSGGTGVTTSTGSGNNVLSNSPTLVSPALGTPSSITLTNGTGLPLTSGVTGLLPIANGGTNASSAATAWSNLGGTSVGQAASTMSGTWTPSLTFGGGATGLTYASRTGAYTRIGNHLYWSCSIQLSAVGSSTGVAAIGGLPFSQAAGFCIAPSVSFNTASGTGAINGYVTTSSSSIALYAAGPTSAVQLTQSNFTATTQIIMQGIVEINSLT